MLECVYFISVLLFLFFLTTPGGTQGFFLAVHLGITPGRFEDHMRFWRSNPGWTHIRQVPCPTHCTIFSAPDLLFFPLVISMDLRMRGAAATRGTHLGLGHLGGSVI